MEKDINQQIYTLNQDNQVKASNKKGKNIFLIIIAIIVTIILAFVIFDVIYDARLTYRLQSYLDGKMYISEGSYFSYVYVFDGNTLSTERWDLEEYSVHGDINKSYRYRINNLILEDNLKLEYMVDGHWCTASYIELNEDGSVEFLYRDWNETTIDEINTLRKVTLCEHKFGNVQLVKKATCSSNGEEKQVCSICGYEQVNEIEKLEHNYINKICSKCGAKKQPQKAYNVEPNTWYTYQDILHFQNIKLQNAFSVSQGKGMMVSYYFVCQHCHVVDETLRQNVPEFNYDINKMFTCEECGGLTTVKIELG